MSALTHLDASGQAHMVDVSAKAMTARVAIAQGHIRLNADARTALASGRARKGDVEAAARIAGIMAAKRTSELIPLCHPVALSSVGIDLDATPSGVMVTATARTTGPTGVEMEALTAVSVALLTLYDMLKSIDRAMTIEDVRLLEKSGGASGDWRAEAG